MQPVKEPIPSFSVPIIQAPKILDNAEPVVEKEIKKTVLTGPPVPVSQQELEEQYIETKAEQEKYKIYEPQKTIPKLNLWAEKKPDRPLSL